MKGIDISAVIGIKTNIKNSIELMTDNEHLLYSLGSNLILRNIPTREQYFLQGHEYEISCIAVSKNNKFIASGQKTPGNFISDIILWDFAEKKEIKRLKIHKVLVKTLNFSPCGNFLVSVGGLEDKNSLVVWDLNSFKAVYGCSLGQYPVSQLTFYNNNGSKMAAVTSNNVQILSIDVKNKKVNSLVCNLGNLKRNFTSIAIENSDNFMFCGTKTGDILEISLKNAIFKRFAPANKLFSLGVQIIKCLPNGDLIVGTGEGKIAKISIQDMSIKNQTQVLGSISSVTFTADYTSFFCTTEQGNLYWIDSSSLNNELRSTSHFNSINDIIFPYNFSEVFATCSKGEIRIWNTKKRQEILRIQVNGVECHCITFMRDGKSIISGWEDGKIRAFYPQSGKLMYIINDAHLNGVTALSTTSDCSRIISGGMEGEIRVWKITRQTQKMEISMKEHRNRVWSIVLRENNEQAISCSSDGSCIIWDLKSFSRILCLFDKTLFKQISLHPDESQVITTGSDRKISYWGVFDGQMIRNLEASEEGEVNSICISRNGKFLVSGGQDKLIKIWNYDEGEISHIGTGHALTINKIIISPDQQNIISVGSDGSIIIWDLPEDLKSK